MCVIHYFILITINYIYWRIDLEPNTSDSFILQTDASGRGIGGVLSVCRNGEELPVVFHSQQLKTEERNYSVTDLEGLVVVDSVRHFEVYLSGQKFVIETDHQALTFLQSAKQLSGHLYRWALLLQGFDFNIRYRNGLLIKPEC